MDCSFENYYKSYEDNYLKDLPRGEKDFTPYKVKLRNKFENRQSGQNPRKISGLNDPVHPNGDIIAIIAHLFITGNQGNKEYTGIHGTIIVP